MGPSRVNTDKHVPGEQRLEITYEARDFSASDFLHGQKRFKPLPEQIAFCKAMAVWLELYQIPLVHFIHPSKLTLTIEHM